LSGASVHLAERLGRNVLGDRTIANATIPLRAALATAKREGLIRHNPEQGRHGTNLLQLSYVSANHSPAFALTRYTHLLPGDEAPPLDLGANARHFVCIKSS
jgi:hypothetical protein